jgi:hypothetical protein
MFVTKAGYNGSGPVLYVKEGYHAGRGGAFGPPRTLRRSIAGSTGYFSEVHGTISTQAQRYDKSGPRQGQLYKKKVMIYAIEDLYGFVESNNAGRVPNPATPGLTNLRQRPLPTAGSSGPLPINPSHCTVSERASEVRSKSTYMELSHCGIKRAGCVASRAMTPALMVSK